MRKTQAAAALLVAALAVSPAAQEAGGVIERATKEMGAEGLTSITYSGSAASGNFGQSRTISFGLASTKISDYTRTIDFRTPASLATGVTTPPAVRGAPPAPQGRFLQNITPADARWIQQLEIWVTPWGFLKGAAANHATVKAQKVEGVPYSVVTWSPAQKAPSGQSYRLVGYINAQNLVERVETWVEHPILGDNHFEVFYSNYQRADGIMVPAKIAQRQTGMETFVVAITRVHANPDDLTALMTPPPAAAGAGRGGAAGVPPPVPAATSEKLAEGVYRITGGYVALAVEFKNYVVVVEAGQNEARGLALLAETNRLFPKKRIKYVVNTHAHFDHAGGLPPFVAEGITIIADDNNKYFLLPALGSPRTLVGDALAKSRKAPKIDGVQEQLVLEDDTQRLELHHVEKLEHSDGMLIAYLPKAKILFTADFNMPAQGQPPSPSIATLVDNIERLHLDFDRYVTVHAPNPDRPLTKADLYALVGK